MDTRADSEPWELENRETLVPNRRVCECKWRESVLRGHSFQNAAKDGRCAMEME